MPPGTQGKPGRRGISRRGIRAAAAEHAGFSMAAAGPLLALASVFDPILVTDLAGTIVWASASTHAVFGWRAEQLTGKPVSILMPEPHRSAHSGHLARYARTGESHLLGHPREFRAVRRDGTEIFVELCVSRAEFPGGEGPFLVGIVRDLSARVRFGAALAEQKRFYEALIAHLPDMVYRLDRSLRLVFRGGASMPSRAGRPTRARHGGRPLGYHRRLPSILRMRAEVFSRLVRRARLSMNAMGGGSSIA